MQLRSARKNHLAIQGLEESELIVLPIVQKSSYAGSWQVDKFFTDALVSQCKDKFSTLHVTAVADTGIKDTTALAIEQNARYVVGGVIITFDIMTRGEIVSRTFSYKEYSVARVACELTLYDVKKDETQIIRALGEFSAPSHPSHSWKVLEKYSLDLTDKQFSQTIMAKALIQALEELTTGIAHALKR